jgi:hypothetical protein
VAIDRRVRVPVADGTELGLTVYMPDAPGDGPFPAIVESLPYRKDDDCFGRDWQTFTYLAARGFTGVRIDIRGTGASDGVCRGEYLPIEQQDNVDVIRWLAQQDWCSGRIGMWGISWGGFSALQTAMLAPPELQAIVAMHATHDRFACDVHYVGGALHCHEQVDWPVGMLATNALPPDPDIVGAGWMDQWLERLEQTPQWLPDWIARQERDAFWEHGSPCEDYTAIRCPTLLIGGWLDPYVDGILALAEHLEAERRVIVGPWGHFRPATGEPGPTLDHFAELERWFGRWLRDDSNGVDDDPFMRVFVRTAPPGAPADGSVTGVWRAETSWPVAGAAEVVLHLADGGLGTAPGGGDMRTWDGSAIVGSAAPFWDLGGWGALDQSGDDDASLVYETEPLDEPLEILGSVVLEAVVSVDARGGRLAARLCEVAPDGVSHLVTRGLLNLSHRFGSAHPSPEPVDEPFPARLELRNTSAVLGVGSRLRLSVAGSDFPIAWPSPRRVAITIHDGSVLRLPVVPNERRRVETPVRQGSPAPSPVTEAAHHQSWRRDSSGTRVTIRRQVHNRETQPERGDLVYSWDQSVTTSVDSAEPAEASARSDVRIGLGRPGWQTEVAADVSLTSDEKSFHLDIDLRAAHDGNDVWTRTWRETLERTWS